jgi:hypothetical protein
MQTHSVSCCLPFTLRSFLGARVPTTPSIKQEVKEKTYWTFVSTDTLALVDLRVVRIVLQARLRFPESPMSTSDTKNWRACGGVVEPIPKYYGHRHKIRRMLSSLGAAKRRPVADHLVNCVIPGLVVCDVRVTRSNLESKLKSSPR